MVPFAIAGVQMHVSALKSNVDELLGKLDLLMIRFPWVQMVLFSELAAYGPLSSNAEALPGPTEQRLQQAAIKHGVWLVPGSLFEAAPDGRIYNTAPVINPQGEVVARYRKMFPFRPYEAEAAGGSEFCVFDVPDVGRFGLSICYDIWFPETTRTLTAMGAEVLLHPVLTGTTDRDIEIAIAQATAAQFQCYVFDINGLDAGGVGRSCIIDPTGNFVYKAAGQEEMMPYEVDLAQVRRTRETGLRGLGQPLKSFRDREAHFDVYESATGRDAYLHTLGPLQTPHRADPAGINALSPAAALAAHAPAQVEHVEPAPAIAPVIETVPAPAVAPTLV